MSADSKRSSRRHLLKTFGVLGAAATLDGAADGGPAASSSVPAADGFCEELRRQVDRTTIADTHEHLPDEQDCLSGRSAACDDWGVLFSHYLDTDLAVAGMPAADLTRLTSRGVAPTAKWALLAPYWPAVKNTGYGRAVRIAIRELYGIDELDEKTIPRLQQEYEKLRRPGFYREILVERARIESCQVHFLGDRPFQESRQPTLLLQDLNITGMQLAPGAKAYSEPTGKQVRDLSDWHAVIRWWFDKYGPYATAVKSGAAYVRGLDYDQVPPEKAEPVFRKAVQRQTISPQEKKLLEDHLFWYAVEQATRHGLPVKLHTGFYAGQGGMPLDRLAGNPQEAAELCRKSPHTQFVFMHIAYPYWQPLVAVAKYYANAHIDMCWAWLLDPATGVQFLKSYLVTAPSNKLFTFGGDYIPVECVLGHARIARQGIARGLCELVEEGWLSRRDAVELVEPLLHGNARRVFKLKTKLERLRKAPWT